MTPQSHSRIDAIKLLAAEKLRDLRSAGRTHEEIASLFDLTVPRVQQLCHDLLGEPDPDHWSWEGPRFTPRRAKQPKPRV